MYLVSACLAGVRCRYDGDSKTVEAIVELVRKGRALPVCPEQMGGLSTPRSPAEIVGGGGEDVLAGKAEIVAESGEIVTEAFLRGAREVLKLARLVEPEGVIFKQRSPSCGFGRIRTQGGVVEGNGVSAALLSSEGFRIVSDEDFVSFMCDSG